MSLEADGAFSRGTPVGEARVEQARRLDARAEEITRRLAELAGRVATNRHLLTDARRVIEELRRVALEERLAPPGRVEPSKPWPRGYGGEREPGVKLDAGKAPVRYLGLLRRSLELVARALEHGARAYGEAPGERNFERVPNGRQRFRDALSRHVLADAAGEWLDADSNDPDATGLPHLVLAAVDALIAVELELAARAPRAMHQEPAP